VTRQAQLGFHAAWRAGPERHLVQGKQMSAFGVIVTASQRTSLEADFTRQKAFERWDRLFDALK